MTDAANDRQRKANLLSVRAGDVELRVSQCGSGMPILLVHGFPLEHSMWNAQIEHLSERWQTIAPDLRGFGGSQCTPGVTTMEQMADDLNALLDALQVSEPIVFCGLSMGGYVAFQFLRKYRSRLRALVLCDTRAAADSAEAAEGRLKLADRVLETGTEQVAEAMLPKLFAAETLQKHPSIVAFERQKILATSPEGVAAALRGMAQRLDFTSTLGEIDLPTLVIVGEHDAITSVDEMRSVSQAIPNAEFVVIPHAGHMTPLENPTAFNEAIEQFLTRVERD